MALQAIRAVLRTKENCSLCHKAEGVLRRIARDVPLDLEVDQVDEDSPLAARVPIVEIGGVEAQAGKVSEFRLRNWLKERGYPDAAR